MTKILKDTGVDRLGKIPSDRKLMRVKNIFFRRKEVNTEADPVVLSLARAGVKVRDISNNEGQLAESYDNYHRVYKKDLMINPMDLYSGANCSVSNVEGVISPAYINLASNKRINSRYFDYYFKTQYWVGAMFAHGKGVSFDNRWTINSDTMMNYYIPFPSYEEQNKISDYLDTICEKIDLQKDNYIKSIELLKDYKKSLIREKVTKGLNDKVKMKDSGVEWIGEIPNNRNISKIGLFFNVRAGGDVKPELYSYTKDDDHPYPVYTNTNDKNAVYAYTSTPMFNENTITVTGRGEIGIAFFRDHKYDAIIRLLSLSPKKKNLDGRFYAYWISNVVHFFSDSSVVGQLSAQQILPYEIPILDLDDQKQIADYLDKKCSKIDNLISYREIAINKLEEYKKSLIYEYVTGKKEVK